MKNLKKRDYCLNPDCLSNYLGKQGLGAEPKIINEKGVIYCEVCGHVSGSVGFSFTGLLMPKLRGLEKNV